jgi:transcription elongation factor S-II
MSTKYSNNSDGVRIKTVIKFNKVLNNLKLSKIVEKSIYNYVIEVAKNKNILRLWTNNIFLQLYMNKCISIYSNLNNDSYIKNNYLLKNILEEKIDPNNIANLSVYDIFPDNWKELMDKKSKVDELKYKLKPEAMTDQFKCRKCFSRSCSYYEVQTRSADEPMTQFITCLNCKNRWKQ